MSLRSQDKKAAIVTFMIIVLWVGYSIGFSDMWLSEASFGSAGIAFVILVIYFLKRRSSYLTSLIKQYCKEQKRKELEMAAVQAAYGRYRLALVEFKLELRDNPDNKLLQEIVSLIKLSL